MQARLDRAKDYLRTSTLLLGQIAHLCGYADQSHFTRTFSRAMGCSPVAWRRLQA
jgi:AraC family transcriptional regulator